MARIASRRDRPLLPAVAARPGGLRAEAARPCVGGRRRLCAARPLRLRQDHAPQHHLRADHAERGPRPFRRDRRHRQADGGAQHRAGLPVPGDLRHHDGGPEPGVSAEEPRRAQARDGAARARGGGDAGADADASAAGAPAHRRLQAEDLARPRAGPPGRGGDPLRRAAHRHRPAPEMGAARADQEAAPRVRPHHGLRHA